MDVVSKDGSTPFMWAVAAQQSEMAEVLIRKGAKVDLSLSPSSQDSPSSKESPSSQDNPSSQDSPSFCLNDRGLVPLQPLHVAARAGGPDSVRLILREGAQVGGRRDGQMDWFSCSPGSTHIHMHGVCCDAYCTYSVMSVPSVNQLVTAYMECTWKTTHCASISVRQDKLLLSDHAVATTYMHN